ncbi:hypothetical protein RvY_18245 [Ramazzottius varieornatus]|uniref:Uncharacterized protein n=1 Tax=Ramazzottius varieornatus TaxID=947166 RepID=A0A1D1WAX2_RAMVA|nr:hypothetical protein RvY_18245 [Ramazzottius varieornatus]
MRNVFSFEESSYTFLFLFQTALDDIRAAARMCTNGNGEVRFNVNFKQDVEHQLMCGMDRCQEGRKHDLFYTMDA